MMSDYINIKRVLEEETASKDSKILDVAVGKGCSTFVLANIDSDSEDVAVDLIIQVRKSLNLDDGCFCIIVNNDIRKFNEYVVDLSELEPESICEGGVWNV